jgi:hypothetical protein
MSMRGVCIEMQGVGMSMQGVCIEMQGGCIEMQGGCIEMAASRPASPTPFASIPAPGSSHDGTEPRFER